MKKRPRKAETDFRLLGAGGRREVHEHARRQRELYARYQAGAISAREFNERNRAASPRRERQRDHLDAEMLDQLSTGAITRDEHTKRQLALHAAASPWEHAAAEMYPDHPGLAGIERYERRLRGQLRHAARIGGVRFTPAARRTCGGRRRPGARRRPRAHSPPSDSEGESEPGEARPPTKLDGLARTRGIDLDVVDREVLEQLRRESDDDRPAWRRT